MQFKTASLQHAFDAMYAAPDYTVTSTTNPEIPRLTVEALARMGVCTLAVDVRTQRQPNPATGIMHNKAVTVWTATLTPKAVQAEQNPDLIVLRKGPAEERPLPAWVLLDSSGVEKVRVRGHDTGEALAAAAALVSAGLVHGVRKLTRRKTAGWLRDFAADGVIYRLESTITGCVQVRAVPSGEVVLVRDTEAEAEAATREESARLAAALTNPSLSVLDSDPGSCCSREEVEIA